MLGIVALVSSVGHQLASSSMSHVCTGVMAMFYDVDVIHPLPFVFPFLLIDRAIRSFSSSFLPCVEVSIIE